jgi:ABC-type transporter Mla subunit MlaD
MSSYGSLNTRLAELTRQLNQKDAEYDQQLDEIIETDLDELEKTIDRTDKDLEEGARKRVEAVKKRIKDRKDELRQKVEAAKNKPKEHAAKEAENALNAMAEDISSGDLDSAHVHRWIANQWLKVSK